ncbi:unnamed protein product, partial [Ectocarpus fasciculatus]
MMLSRLSTKLPLAPYCRRQRLSLLIPDVLDQGLRLRPAGNTSKRSSTTGASNLFNPTEEHQQLREMVRSFVENEVDPQALQYNREEKFNAEAFKRLGELGLLGVTVAPQHGGSGMDASAACIVHEELSAADPALCLSYLG